MFQTVRKKIVGPGISELHYIGIFPHSRDLQLSDQEMSLPPSFVRNTLRDLYSEPPSDPQQLREDEDAIKYSSFSFYRGAHFLCTFHRS